MPTQPKLRMNRPLVFFDLETTGTDPASDRIVEIAAIRLEPDGSRSSRCRRLNPERPIPRGASAVHGIHDQDVADSPTFKQIARSLLDFFEGADLAGFNVYRSDDEGGSWPKLVNPGSPLPPSTVAMELVDPVLLDTRDYWYKVRAVDNIANESGD